MSIFVTFSPLVFFIHGEPDIALINVKWRKK